MHKTSYFKGIYYILLIFAIAALGVFLKLSSSFTLPVTVAILVSCVFYPIVKKMNQKLKIPWILGTLLTAVLFIIIISLLITIMGTSLSTLVAQLSKYESKLQSIYKIFAETFNLQFDKDLSFFENIWGQLKVREFVQSVALAFSGNVISVTKSIFIILLLSVFLLLEMRTGHEKVDAMFQGKVQGRILKIIKITIAEVVHYLSIKFFISLATGILVYAVLKIIKLDFAIMWAFLAFSMNFIPTFGSILSVGITSLFALIQFYPSPFPIIFVLVSMTAINMVLGNIVEPRIEGDNLGLSPFVILVSLSFWGWMWGFVGMIIAVPLMVMIKIICENVSYLHPIAILIGNKPNEIKKELSEVEPDSEDDVFTPLRSVRKRSTATGSTTNSTSTTTDSTSTNID